MPFTCPQCGRTSHNPNDAAQNYCGNCHVFLDDVQPPLKPFPPIDAVPLQRGDFVMITTDTGRQVDAMVTHASPNGRSLLLMFDAMIGGWMGTMPIFQENDGSWWALDQMPITLTKRRGI